MWHSWCFGNNFNASKLPNRNSQLLLLELTCSVIWLYYFTSLNSSRRSSIISAIGNTNYVLNRGLCNSFATCWSSTVQRARVWAVAVSSHSDMTDKWQGLNGHKCGRLRVWGRYFSEIVRNKFTFRNSLDWVLFVSFSVFYSSTSTYITYPSLRQNSAQKETKTFKLLSTPTLFRDVPCFAAIRNDCEVNTSCSMSVSLQWNNILVQNSPTHYHLASDLETD